MEILRYCIFYDTINSNEIVRLLEFQKIHLQGPISFDETHLWYENVKILKKGIFSQDMNIARYRRTSKPGAFSKFLTSPRKEGITTSVLCVSFCQERIETWWFHHHWTAL